MAKIRHNRLVGQVENPRRSEKAKGLTTHNDRNQRQKKWRQESGDKKTTKKTARILKIDKSRDKFKNLKK